MDKKKILISLKKTSYFSDMVRKDVLRTDRHYPFYSGDDNPNVNQLFNVLTTYLSFDLITVLAAEI